MAFELKAAGLFVERQKDVAIRYKDLLLASPLRLDLLVEQSVVVECKSMSRYNDIFAAGV